MSNKELVSNRRMGPPGSPAWLAMIDGAEAVLREEGFAALTSRRVAERIGVKQRLVYYYFHSMEDLAAETFRRHAKQEMEKLQEALASDQPLRRIWDFRMRKRDARLISEFIALANRIEPLKLEVAAFIEQSRAIQVNALEAALKSHPAAGSVSPAALAIFASGAALTLIGEAALDVRTGHEEALSVIDHFLRVLEPPAQERPREPGPASHS